MGKKSQPAPQPAPDPYAIIGAQTEANRPNQNTPFGSLTWQGNTSNINLSPELQNLFNTQMGISNTAADRAQYGLNNLSYQDPYANFQGASIPGLQTLSGSQIPQAPQLSTPYAAAQSMPGLQTSLQGLGPLSNPNLQTQIGGLDFSGASKLPSDYNAYRNASERAFFDRSAGLLNEQFGRQDEALQQRLANQGLQAGSQAYGSEYNQFNQNRNQAFQNLANDAVLFGGQEASRGLADQMALRGMGTNEAQALFNAGLTQGNFGNQALMNQANMGNQNALSQFNAGLTQGNFANQALGQQFGMGTDIRNQNLQNQMFGNDIANQNFANQNQVLQNQLAQLAQNNATRLQGFNETGAMRGSQFNELASLLGLQQVNPSQLLSGLGGGGSGVNAADAFGIQQSALNNAYNTQANNAAAKKGNTAQLAGTLGTAAIMFSDRRLKKNARKIGRYKGHNIYLWIWNKFAEKLGLKGYAIGVLADEIPKEFVSARDGYLAVNYGAL